MSRTEEEESWWFPELGRSFKQVFIIQMLACYLLCFIIGNWWDEFSLMGFGLAFAITTLKDCAILQAGVAQHRADVIAEKVQERLHAQRQGLPSYEGRLLDREQMTPPPPPPQRDSETTRPEW